MTTLDAALECRRRGWCVVPIPAGEKGPHCRGWQDLDIERGEIPQQFSGSCNVGVILGSRSGELIDADLDCPEALALADIYLPPTDGIFGRASKPRSHRLYVAPGSHYESFGDPLIKEKSTLLEIRADGRDGGAHQTILPPSIADGEQRRWDSDVIAPGIVVAVALRTAVAWLAVGCLVMRYISESAARQPGADLPRLCWECDHALGRVAYRWLGKPDPDSPRRNARPRREMSQADVDLAELVAAIPNDFDWNGWNSTGLAIFAVTGGSDEGFVAFDNFSAKSSKYDPHSVEQRWRNFRRSPPVRTGIGKLIKLARQAGWRPPARRPDLQ